MLNFLRLESKKNVLQKLENCDARIVTNSYVASVSQLLSNLECPFFDESIKGEKTSMLYKSINNLASKYICNFLSKTSSRDIISLRSSETDLYVPVMNTKKGQESFSYHGANLWNGMKPTSRNAPTLFAFKKAMKQEKL